MQGQTTFNMTLYDYSDEATNEILKAKTGAEIPKYNLSIHYSMETFQ